jgi:hypothetical protein
VNTSLTIEVIGEDQLWSLVEAVRTLRLLELEAAKLVDNPALPQNNPAKFIRTIVSLARAADIQPFYVVGQTRVSNVRKQDEWMFGVRVLSTTDVPRQHPCRVEFWGNLGGSYDFEPYFYGSQSDLENIIYINIPKDVYAQDRRVTVGISHNEQWYKVTLSLPEVETVSTTPAPA